MLEGKQIGSILAADGQGDDVAVLVRFNNLTYGIYVTAGPAPTVPVITREPLDTTVFEKATAPFTVAAAGVGPLRYQWRRDGVDLPGKIGNYFEVPDASAGDHAGYSVVVSNDSGSVTSRTAQLTTVIPSRPVVWAQPWAPALYFGSNATFSVTASGAEPMHYQWHKRDGVSDGPIPGAVASSLTLAGLGLADKASYFVTISNAGGGVVSSQVTIFSFAPVDCQPPTADRRRGGRLRDVQRHRPRRARPSPINGTSIPSRSRRCRTRPMRR